jgi:ATP-dependent DNA ligase
MLSRFDALAGQVGRLLDVDEAVIDGEVIAADETGRPQFYDLLQVPRSVCYVAFDILWLDGADLRPLPLSERRRRLQGILPVLSASRASGVRHAVRVLAAATSSATDGFSAVSATIADDPNATASAMATRTLFMGSFFTGIDC